MQKTLVSFIVSLSLSIGFVRAVPPCSGSRPVPICAQFINPYFYNGYQWQAACGVNVASETALIAYNGIMNSSATPPDW